MKRKKELYIPLNVIESQDLISGIGGKEIGYIGGALLAGVILAVMIFMLSGSMVLAVLVGGTGRSNGNAGAARQIQRKHD